MNFLCNAMAVILATLICAINANSAPADSAEVDAEFQQMFGALTRVNDKATSALAKSDTALAEVRTHARRPTQVIVKKVPYAGPGAYTMQVFGEAADKFARQQAYNEAIDEVLAVDGDTSDVAQIKATQAWKEYARKHRTNAGRKETAEEFVSAILNGVNAALSLGNANTASSEIAVLQDSVNALKGRVNTLAARIDSTDFRLAVVRLATLDALRSLAIYGDDSRRSSKARRKQLAEEAQAIKHRL